jgi:hypothetical protein
LWAGDGRQADLEAVFGPTGIWRELLGRMNGYIETELQCESPAERKYRVLDFWVSHWRFETFREKFAAEYDRFNELVSAEGLVERQQVVGTYYESSDGDDLVPAES